MRNLVSFCKREPVRIIAGLLLFIPALIVQYTTEKLYALPLYITALLFCGLPVFISAVRGVLRKDFLDEKFLMSIASIGAMIIGEYSEGVAVMLFFLVGEFFEHKAVRKSRNSIKELMDIKPDTARVLVDGEENEEDAEDVPVGSLIVIRPGERVPIDCEILSGLAELDTSALTGESVPRAVKPGDLIDSGVIVLGGVLTCRTVRIAEESRAARILELVENATERKSREENFISAFSKVYTPIVTALALLMAIIPPLFELLTFEQSVYRALSFLVVSCPCALVISVPMAFFGGIGGAASVGILYKGGNTFASISRPETVIFDKTGTLTGGEFSISSVNPVGIESEKLLYLVASAEHNSNHPIARCLSKASEIKAEIKQFEERIGRGIVAEVDGHEVGVGNLLLMQELGAEVILTDNNVGTLYVSYDGKYVGSVTVSDEIKPEAAEAIKALNALGVKKTVILSGDAPENVESVSKSLNITEAHSSLLPEDKYRILESISERSVGGVVYVGDGINDAPCLARADVGIAMGSKGSDSAIEAADAVIMSDNLKRLPDAIKIARKTMSIAKQNIVFAIGIKLLVLGLVAFDVAGMWMAVFADVGVAVLAILNSMRTLLFGRRNRK